MMKSALSAALAALALLACAPFGDSDSTASKGPTSRASDEPGSCAYGPWADHCPEAEWARQVLDAAGYRLTGDTGSALVGRAGQTGFYFWAFESEKAPNQPLSKAIEDEGYRVLEDDNETRLFTDGTRIAWQIQGLYVWLEGGPMNSLDDIDDEVIRKIVRASGEVPYR
jgi:hypothetical protein